MIPQAEEAKRLGRRPSPALSVLAALWCGAAFLLLIAAVQHRVPVADLLRDPSYTTGTPWYTGALSQVGVLGWCGSAVVMLSGAYLVRILVPGNPRSRFLAVGGILSMVLLLDDLFTLHEEVLPSLVGAGEHVIVASYAVAVATWVLTFRQLLPRFALLPLTAAIALFGLMMAIEVLMADTEASWRILVEDGAKLFGICSWLAFSLMLVVDAVVGVAEAPPAPKPGLRRMVEREKAE